MIKQCTKCKKGKPEEEFNFKVKSKNLRQAHCKECTRNFVKNHYNENKEYYLAKAQKRNKYFREQVNSYVRIYLLNHPCVDCGEKDPVVLEFDHIDRVSKVAAISNLIRDRAPLTRIQEEMDKCVIRCSNCHKRKTAKDFKWFKQMHP